MIQTEAQVPMSDTPRVSVLLAVFNGEKYLAEAVQSVLSQSLKAIEFLVVDDGSTDATPQILAKFASLDSRMRVLTGPNEGVGQAMINGIATSRGEFIARMDADDVCLPNRLERQLDYMINHPECAVVGSALVIIDSDGDPVCNRRYPLTHEEIDGGHLMGKMCGMAQPSTMIRRSMYDRAGGYRSGYEPAEDLDLWFRIGEVGKLANLPDLLLKYRVHSESATATRSRLMQENTRRITVEGCRSRGIPPPPDSGFMVPEKQPMDGAVNYSRNLSCLAWEYGFYRTARKHARRQLLLEPINVTSWKYSVRCSLGPFSRPLVRVGLSLRSFFRGTQGSEGGRR